MIERIIAHFLSHPAGVVGLLLNVAGTLLLLRVPSAVGEYTPEGLQVVGGWSELPQSDSQREDWKRRAARHRLTYHLAVGLLLIGFSLQLFDLLIG